MSTPRRRRNIRLTPRDDQILDQMIRFQAMTAPILGTSHLTPASRTGVYAILQRLAKAGLLEDVKTGPSNYSRPKSVTALYVPTKAAHRYRGSPLLARPVSLSRVLHTLAVAQVGLAYLRLGYDVVTDREMQQQRAAAVRNPTGPEAMTRTWLSMGNGPVVPPSTHVPDLVVTPPNSASAAIEVELSRKNNAALERVLRMYGRTQMYSHVVYVVPDESMAARVQSVWNSILLEHRNVTLSTHVLPPVPPLT